MISLAVVILTHNEAHHIGRAIDSIAAIASEIFVIDSGSSDGTIDIARQKGATVLTNPWVNHATQFQWGLDHAPITAEWIMRLDADEIVEEDLAHRLSCNLCNLSTDVTGIQLKRKHIFMGRWIRHGGRYPLILLRVWRRGIGRVENRWMDEHVVLSHGRSVICEGGFSDANLGNITYFTNKHNKYATLEAVEVLNQRHSLFERDEAMSSQKLSQAKRKRGIKERIYNKLPFGIGPLIYFLFRYIVQLGFLDGKEGAVYHVLQGYWYRFLVDGKVLELEKEIAGLPDRRAQLNHLRAITGLKL